MNLYSLTVSAKEIAAGRPAVTPESLARLGRAHAVFDKMRRPPYNIHIPEIDPPEVKIDEVDGQEKIFVKMDKIIGVPLKEALRKPDERVVEETTEFVNRTSLFMADMAQNHEDIPYDFSLENCRYGRKEGEIGDRVYFIDTEPLVARYEGPDADPSSGENLGFMNGVKVLAQTFRDIAAVAPGVTTRIGFQRIREFVDGIPAGSPLDSMKQRVVESLPSS